MEPCTNPERWDSSRSKIESWYSGTADFEANMRAAKAWRSQNGYYDHTRRSLHQTGKLGSFVVGSPEGVPGAYLVRADDGCLELRDLVSVRAEETLR